MTIGPAKSGSANPLIGPWPDRAGGKQSARQSGEVKPAAQQAPHPTGTGGDQLCYLAEARAPGGGEEVTRATGIPAERLRSILDRISSNYYETPQVRDSVARKLWSEFTTMQAR